MIYSAGRRPQLRSLPATEPAAQASAAEGPSRHTYSANNMEIAFVINPMLSPHSFLARPAAQFSAPPSWLLVVLVVVVVSSPRQLLSRSIRWHLNNRQPVSNRRVRGVDARTSENKSRHFSTLFRLKFTRPPINCDCPMRSRLRSQSVRQSSPTQRVSYNN